MSNTAMSEVAERYASAFFDIAKDMTKGDASALGDAEKDLLAFADIVKSSDDLQRVAKSPLIKPEAKAAAFVEIAKAAKLSDLVQRMVGVAAQNRRASDITTIARGFSTLAAQERGATQVIVRTAKPLDAEQKKRVESLLNSTIGKGAEIAAEIDENLLGGLQIKLGSRLIDASVRSKLNALKLATKGV